MGGVIIESSRVATHTEDVVVENVVKDANKRKKRRSRRSKPNYSLSACSSVSEICMDESSSLGNTPSNDAVSNGHQQDPKENDAGFSSMPAMHINEENADENLQNQHLIHHENSELIVSKSGPEPFVCEETVGPVLVPRLVDCHARQKYFRPHSSAEAISKGLEKGELLRALFRVNAHNKLEAYCKIDGVPTDVLINGVTAQNRAFEGDTVAIAIDPPSLWPKMKGSNEILNNSVSHANCSPQNEALLHCQESSKGKNKLGLEHEHACSSNNLVFPEDGTYYENGSSCGVISENSFMNGSPDVGYTDSYWPSTPHSARPGCFDDEHGSVISLEKLCTLVSLHLSKRPTGRVVAIISMSRRRDNIVGFLSVKQWLFSRDSKRKDFKKNKHRSHLNHGYILLTPTDPKFTKMIVPVKNLPESINKRLEVGDLSVENDLVAAKVVDWAEESFIPEARVIQNFGRGSDVEAQIAAILFENAICSEFSAEALSCLPNLPWEVPHEELQSRRDLRNFCVFTIDAETATDLDDALSVESLSNGNFRVGVHIADVSYFVSPDTALDIDAQSRSTSVYLLRRKIPMLPPMLSDNLASLNPGVDRLAFSIFWDINPMGEVLDRWIGRTIIQSCCKLSYNHAQEIIDGAFDAQDSSGRENHWPEMYGQFKLHDVTKSVKCLNDLSKILKENRFKGGAISLESPKIVFLFDEDGIPYDSVLSGRRNSNFLVEEFMLLANRTAAEVIARAYPSCALLRRHPKPNARKLREFEAFCSRHGLTVDISSSTHLHRSLENIREELKNNPILFDILMSYAARPMQLAAYFCSGDLKDIDSDWGHFSLAVPLYTHFTSPLRRYPDILVHRTLAATLEAENIYLEGKRMLHNLTGNEVLGRCFTGLFLDKDDIESVKAQEALSNAAVKFRVPCTETLVDMAAYCNEKKQLATRYVKDATNKLYMWVLLKRKRIVYSEARVLGLGPRFMSIHISKLAIERRIYYDEIEGLTVEWLDATSTLVISHSMDKRSNRKSSPGKCRKLEEVALIVNPTDLKLDMDLPEHCVGYDGGSQSCDHEPAVFPLTMNLLSTIPVALHAVGGDDGPLDIVARLYISSYFH